jgi:hypothetical protein
MITIHEKYNEIHEDVSIGFDYSKEWTAIITKNDPFFRILYRKESFSSPLNSINDLEFEYSANILKHMLDDNYYQITLEECCGDLANEYSCICVAANGEIEWPNKDYKERIINIWNGIQEI